jgi:hypothetical protein
VLIRARLLTRSDPYLLSSHSSLAQLYSELMLVCTLYWMGCAPFLLAGHDCEGAVQVLVYISKRV